MERLPPDDIEHILRHTANIWKDLRGSRIFITGGTGFFGKWLLGSFLAANDRFNLKASITVLSRNPAKFQHAVPHLAKHPAVRLIKGDVRNFSFPKGNFTHLIHGAVDASLKLIREEPLLVFDTIIQGARRALEFAGTRGVEKVLLISSGAVYGRQPAAIKRLAEEYRGAPDFTGRYAIYGESLRAAETLGVTYAAKKRFELKIVRCFSFVGPHLPLDAHFAIGNFIRDALAGKTIRLESDGSPRRSYLYAADLAIWLWTILVRGKNMRSYNVGSEKSSSLAATAALVAKLSGNSAKVKIARRPGKARALNVYVPDTRRARAELGLKQFINLRNAIQKTIDFYRA
jgi:dTDP-glucose 4,6-dehydratase